VSDDTESGPEGPSPLRRTLEILVFAPVGAAMTVAEELPALIAKGRQRVEGPLRNAHIVGRFVVTKGQRDIGQRVERLLHGEPASPETPEPAAEAKPESPAPAKPAPDPADGAAVERALAGYDTLSASQVVRRLESLGPDELRALQRHEASHRNRRTILNRTSQLLGGAHTDGTARPPTDPSTE